MRTALFWDVTQRVVAISTRLFGTTHQPFLQGSTRDLKVKYVVPGTRSLIPEEGKYRLSQMVGKKNFHYVMSPEDGLLCLYWSIVYLRCLLFALSLTNYGNAGSKYIFGMNFTAFIFGAKKIKCAQWRGGGGALLGP